MKITHVEAWQVVVPCRPGVLSYEGRWCDPENPGDPEPRVFDSVPKWIVRVHADNGLSGVGESFRGESRESVEAGIAAIVDRDPRTFSLQRLPLPANAEYLMFEMAIFDLLGKTWEVPVYQLLGGAAREHVLVDYWSSRKSPEDAARIAAKGKDQGFTGIKLKAAVVGPIGNVTEDDPIVERVAAIADACGPDFTITVDPNFRFHSYERTVELARALEPFNLLALEDPFPWRGAVPAYARLRRETGVPIAIHTDSPEIVYEAITAGAVDAFNLRPSMADFVRMAWMAAQAGIPCWCGSGVDLGIRDMSVLHACIATASCSLPVDMVGNFLREDDLIVEPIRIVDGRAERPSGVGLGIELDEEALRRYAVAEAA